MADSDFIFEIAEEHRHPSIVCSECYDALGVQTAGFDAIMPQSPCDGCGRLCLGYRLMPNGYIFDRPSYPAVRDIRGAKS